LPVSAGQKAEKEAMRRFRAVEGRSIPKLIDPPVKQVSVSFSKAELWELINNFGQSYEAGGEGNELADKVMAKLAAAYDKVRIKPK
jgi:hypothetical protein